MRNTSPERSPARRQISLGSEYLQTENTLSIDEDSSYLVFCWLNGFDEFFQLSGNIREVPNKAVAAR
jgi:hypothetical protein